VLVADYARATANFRIIDRANFTIEGFPPIG
jgi:hypothetical protein